MQYRLFARDGFWEASVDGLVSVESWDQMLNKLGTEVAATRIAPLVIDLTGIVGFLGTIERQEVGRLFATHLRAVPRVALFIEKAKITGVVQTRARSEGLDLTIFPSRDEAVEWIGLA